jgi:hypothetical protein
MAITPQIISKLRYTRGVFIFMYIMQRVQVLSTHCLCATMLVSLETGLRRMF